MIKPFKITIEESILTDLKNRLAQTRWPKEIENSDWQSGTNKEYLKELCDYWQNEFDWKKNEAGLNTLPQYITDIDNNDIHFIHEKGKGSKCLPLLLIHGFPDSFTRFLKILPQLTSEDENGICFDVIIPSIPGYGFSGIPTAPGMSPQKVAEIFNTLMTDTLGYENYFVLGGDWGSTITELLALSYPKNIAGIHLTDMPFHHLYDAKPENTTDAEKEYLKKGLQWQTTEGGYAIIQSTKHQTVAYGLNDSPAGLASWIVEKFYLWSDAKGNIENCFTKDELLTNITIYWATQTINSAMRLYFEAMNNPPKDAQKKVEVPTAFAIFPKEFNPPKEFAQRFYNIKQWTEMPEGGHFAAMEQPERLVEDFRKFAGSLAAM